MNLNHGVNNGLGDTSKYNMLNYRDTSNSKYVLIKESNDTPLSLKPVAKAGDYTMEGIFAFFGRENENGRIYDEVEYLPHLEYLIEKVKKKKLLGELDHPKEFDISLNNVSHIIEDLWMDKDKRVLMGRIKVLIDTPKGQILKALIDNGIPVSISSRAAGTVENNKKVKIKRIFTFDVVQDPGFGDEAELQRVYESINYNFQQDDYKKYLNISESLGINNKTIQIYDLGNDEQKVKSLLEKTSVKEMSYVSEKDFNAYTDLMNKQLNRLQSLLENITSKNEDSDDKEELKNQISELKSKLDNLESLNKGANTEEDNSILEKVAKLERDLEFEKQYVDHIFSNLNEAKGELKSNNQYLDHFYSNLRKFKKDLKISESYSKHLFEKLVLTNSKVSENEQYTNHLFENLKHAKTELEFNDKYVSHLYENLKHVNSEVEFNNKYSEHLYDAAKVLLNENAVSTAYMQHLKENISTLNESKVIATPVVAINESKNVLSFEDKIDSLLNAVKNKETAIVTNQPNQNFFTFLSEAMQQQFLALDETKKQKVVTALAINSWSTESDIINIMNESLVEHLDENRKWLVEIPNAYKEKWSKLSESKQQEIIAQTANYNLQTEYQIKWFWDTRNLDESIGFVPLNENKNTANNASSLGYTIDDNLLASIGKSFNK